NRYVVGGSVDVDPKIPDGLWEIALRPAYRMRAGELSVSDHPGAEDTVMRQRGILRVLKPAGPRGVNIVRSRVEGIQLVVLENAEHEVMLGVGDVVEPADVLSAVLRKGKCVASKPIGIRKRRHR